VPEERYNNMHDARDYTCGKCGYTVASVTNKVDEVILICKRCFDRVRVPLVGAAERKIVYQTAVSDVESFDYGKSDFTIDHLNMITAPRMWTAASGFLLRPESTGFVCAYVTADRNHVRFPANHYNIDKLLEHGIAKKHMSGAAGVRLATSLQYRMAELDFRQAQFERAEKIKIGGGKEEIPTPWGVTMKRTAGTWVDAHTCKDRAFYYQQRAGVELGVAVKRVLFAYEQRTGKTPMLKALEQELRDQGEIDAVFIIAPVRLLNTAWRDENDRYTPGNRSIIMNSEATRLEAINYDWTHYLSSFESAAINWRVMRQLYDPKRIMVIMDETVKLKNPKAKRTLGNMGISLEVEYLYELSGAPVSRLHQDIWPQAFCIDPGILGDNIDAFAASFFTDDGRGNVGFMRHRKALFHDLSGYYMLRCTRGEAEQFTGRDTYTMNVRLKADPVQAEVYKHMLNAYMAVLETADGMELENEAANVLVQLLRLREICSGFFSFETGPGVFGRARLPGNPKVDWLKDFIDTHPGQQMIIFCEFNEGEAIVADTLDELGVSWGGLLKAKRERTAGHSYGTVDDIFADHVTEFQDGKRTFFVGKHSSIGHGLTLSSADGAIFWNMGFNSDNYDQARMRPVSGGTCSLIYHLMISGSLETEHIYPTLRGRGDLKKTIMQDAGRKGYYSFFEEMSKSALEVAAATTYDVDTLELEARKVTGYDGPLSINMLDRWLRGDNPWLARLDMIRSAGSTMNAYRKIVSIYEPGTPFYNKLSDDDRAIASTIRRVAEQATEKRPEWEKFITAVAERIETNDSPTRAGGKMFDLMVAYLRMKSA